jgi:hypothetical protein
MQERKQVDIIAANKQLSFFLSFYRFETSSNLQNLDST